MNDLENIPHRPAKNRRLGFTLVELLVVIAIIGILIALLLPAVQAAREAARRMQCGNNLKQLALGILNYQSTFNQFPAGVTEEWVSTGSRYNMWTVRVMPYMELNEVYDRWNFDEGYGGDPKGPGGARVNTPLMEMTISTFCCPSDATSTAHYKTGNESRSNYAGCFSPSGKMVEPTVSMPWADTCNQEPESNPSAAEMPQRKAIFNFNVFRRTSAIKDGFSNTIGLSEVIGVQDDLRGCWWHPWGAQYTHHRMPNTLIPDDMIMDAGYCDSTPDAPCTRSTCGYTDLDCAARSKHPGGVNAARLDGSVNFYSNNITLGIWQALGSIDGGETLQQPVE